MSNQPLYLSNCTPYYLQASLNDQTQFPISLPAPVTTPDGRGIPWSTKAFWGAQAVSSGVLAENSNIMKIKFSTTAGGSPVYDKVYINLSTPGYGGSSGPQPTSGDLYMWIFNDFLLFSQYGKAQMADFGTMPPAPGWRALPVS